MNSDQIKSAIKEIELCSEKAANSVKAPLLNADLQAYKNFLNMMYHYTLTSGDKLAVAAKKAPNEELKSFFDHMFKEERYHYKLAEQDLKGFGLKPDSQTPEVVSKFNKFWESLGNGHFNGYLGALYVFENIADKVGGEIKDLLSRLNVTEKQRRWLSIHVEADEEHGSLISDLLKKYIGDNTQAAIDAAKEAQKRWSEIMVTAFA